MNKYYLLGLTFLGVVISLLLWSLDHQRHKSDLDSETESKKERIICVAPSIAEVVFALGQGDRVIAVSQFTHFPPEAAEKEKIGGVVNPNFEQILLLRPDFIILLGEMDQFTAFCEQKNIAYMNVTMMDLETVLDDIQRIGNALDCTEEAKTLVQNIRKDLANIQEKAAEKESPRVFVCMGRKAGSLNGLFSISRESFLHDLIEIAGGTNIFADISGAYPQVSKEALLKRAPEVILEMNVGDNSVTDSGKSLIKDWESLPELPAVASERVYLLTQEYIMIPGPRMPQIAEIFYECFYEE